MDGQVGLSRGRTESFELVGGLTGEWTVGASGSRGRLCQLFLNFVHAPSFLILVQRRIKQRRRRLRLAILAVLSHCLDNLKTNVEPIRHCGKNTWRRE